jgi:hypothetical protein
VKAERKWLLYQLGHRYATDFRGREVGGLQEDPDCVGEQPIGAAKHLERAFADVTRRLYHVLGKHVAFDIPLPQRQRIIQSRATGAGLDGLVDLEFPVGPTGWYRKHALYQ